MTEQATDSGSASVPIPWWHGGASEAGTLLSYLGLIAVALAQPILDLLVQDLTWTPVSLTGQVARVCRSCQVAATWAGVR